MTVCWLGGPCGGQAQGGQGGAELSQLQYSWSLTGHPDLAEDWRCGLDLSANAAFLKIQEASLA